MGWARGLAAELPECDVVVPDGLEAVPVWGGRRWYDRTEGLGDWAARVDPAGAAISRWIDGELERRGLPRDRVAIVGFSQGAIMAQWLAVRRRPNPLAAVSFAGRFAVEEPVATSGTATPVLLLHGSDDRVIPVGLAHEAEADLRARGAKVELVIEPGLGHRISGAEMARAVGFLREHAGAR